MGAFVIVLREAFEACLVLGIVFAFLKQSGQLDAHGRTVWLGTAAAVGVSVAVGAVLFATVGEVEGTAEAIYEGVLMLVAATLVTWMLFWMRRQARTIGGELRTRVGDAVVAGGGMALAAVAFAAVLREGIETALFLFVSVGDDGLVPTVVGGVAGLAVAIVLGVGLYRGSIKLDLRRFFRVTGILVIAFAAYLVGGALGELGEAAGTEALEIVGPIAAVAYAITCGWLYLREPALSRVPAPAPAGASAS